MSTLKLTNGSSNAGYARALRAIGRTIASSFPESLAIEVVGAAYKVQYQVRTKAVAQKKDAKPGVLKKLFNKSPSQTAEQNPAQNALASETRTFNQIDIDGIYASQSSSRKRAGGSPDIYELGEKLRTVGRVVELNQGQLLRVTKNANSISFQYSDLTGEIHGEELTNQNLFRLQQEYNATRQNKDGDIWERDAR